MSVQTIIEQTPVLAKMTLPAEMSAAEETELLILATFVESTRLTVAGLFGGMEAYQQWLDERCAVIGLDAVEV